MKALFRRRLLILFLALVFVSSVSAQSVRFAVIADTHIGAGNSAADLEAIVRSVNGFSGISFAVVDGDIAEKGRDAEYAAVKRLLAGLRLPWHVVPGNHDSHWIGQALIGFREAFPSDRFFFEEAGRYFIGLNTWDFGHLAPDDLAWLAERVRTTPPEAEIFFFAHHPPALVDNWSEAQKILRHRKSVVVNGHVHRTEIIDSSGLPVITVRKAISSAASPSGFALIESSGERIQVYDVEEGQPPRLFGEIPTDRLGIASEIPPRPKMRDAAEILGRTKLGIRVSLAPVLAGRFVVIVDNAGRIQAFDRAGRKKWTHDPKSLSASRPAGDDKFVYAATAKGKILKLKAASGRLVRSGDVGERVTSPLVLFADGQKRERLLAGTLSGRLVCLDAERLAAVWTSEAAKDMIQSRPLVVGGKVVYGSWDARLHAVEAGTGRALWSWTENDNIYYAPAGCGPVSDGSRVFVCSPDGNVSAVDLATGKTVWREKYSAWESLGISADRTKLFIKSRTDEFNLVDAAEGRLLRRTAPAHGNGDTMPVSPVEEKDKIYYGALDGRVYEIDRAGGIKTILDLGPAGVQTLLPLGEGRFAAVNLDGTLVVFRISS